MSLAPEHGIVKSIIVSGLWRFFPFLLLYSIGFATLYPLVPTLITNGFASMAAGYPLDCQQYSPSTAPVACQDAHAKAVIWSSWTSFVSGAILSFLCAPIVGNLSDHIGRKPFMLLGIVLSLGPCTVLALFLKGLVRIYWYYPLSALNGAVSSITMILTSVADLMHPSHRAVSAGFCTAGFSVGFIVGPFLGASLAPQQAVYACMAMIGITFLYVLFFIPECAPRRRNPIQQPTDKAAAAAAAAAAATTEDSSSAVPHLTKYGADDSMEAVNPAYGLPKPSLDPESALGNDGNLPVAPDSAAAKATAAASGKAQGAVGPRGGSSSNSSICGAGGTASGATAFDAATAGTSQSSDGCVRPADSTKLLTGWQILARSSWYRKLALIWIITSIVSTGVQDLLLQYLQLTLGFNTKDQANIFIISACSSLSIKVVLLALLVRFIGEQWLLALGLAASASQYLLLIFAGTKAAAFASVGVGACSVVTWPAMVALQSSRVDPRSQGAVAGVLQGLSSLSSGVGPLPFALLFSLTTRSDAPYYAPQAVFCVACGLAAVAMLLAATLHWGEEGPAAPATQSGVARAGQTSRLLLRASSVRSGIARLASIKRMAQASSVQGGIRGMPLGSANAECADIERPLLDGIHEGEEEPEVGQQQRRE